MNPNPKDANYICEVCKDVEGRYACQECCPHEEQDHYICIDCGYEGEPSDYYDEDYGRDR
jgi:hypothetical protein